MQVCCSIEIYLLEFCRECVCVFGAPIWHSNKNSFFFSFSLCSYMLRAHDYVIDIWLITQKPTVGRQNHAIEVINSIWLIDAYMKSYVTGLSSRLPLAISHTHSAIGIIHHLNIYYISIYVIVTIECSK